MGKIENKVEIVENFNGWKGECLIKELGASYIRGRDVKEIAKDVRSIIKKAIKAGYLPTLKASVTISRYSGGCSLDVEIMEIGATVINVDAWRQQAANRWMLSWMDCGGRYNQQGRDVLEFLERVIKAFQKSESHSQSDYHNTNFYGHVEFDHQVLQQQFEKLGEESVESKT